MNYLETLRRKAYTEVDKAVAELSKDVNNLEDIEASYFVREVREGKKIFTLKIEYKHLIT